MFRRLQLEHRRDAHNVPGRSFTNFQANLRAMVANNRNKSRTFVQAVNKFSDLDYQSFKNTFLMKTNSLAGRTMGSSQPRSTEARASDVASSTSDDARKPPKVTDWRNAPTAVTAVKDQGACGSCWAFAVTAVIESAYVINQGVAASSLDLSEQQLLSCAHRKYGWSSSGCEGGWLDRALDYVIAVNQTTEDRYSYTGTEDSCSTVKVATTSGQALQLSGSAVWIDESNEDALMAAVDRQPVMTYFDVQKSFQSYHSGIYNGDDCSTTGSINHAMVIVGYNYTGDWKTSYFFLRNSYGTTWGEDGYMRVAMTGPGTHGTCGMYLAPMAPQLSFTEYLTSNTPEPSPSPSPSPNPSPGKSPRRPARKKSPRSSPILASEPRPRRAVGSPLDVTVPVEVYRPQKQG